MTTHADASAFLVSALVVLSSVDAEGPTPKGRPQGRWLLELKSRLGGKVLCALELLALGLTGLFLSVAELLNR